MEDDKLKKMNPRCAVGVLGSGQAIEALWEIVYSLKEKVEKLEKQLKEVQDN